MLLPTEFRISNFEFRISSVQDAVRTPRVPAKWSCRRIRKQESPQREPIFKRIQSDTQALSSQRVRRAGEEACWGAPGKRLHVLDTVCGDDVLPARTRSVAARDHRWAAIVRGKAAPSGDQGGPGTIDPGVCQQAPAVGDLSGRVRSIAGAMPPVG